MELKMSDDYEGMAIEWQYQLVELLKQSMAKHGVADDKAKEIVGEYMFEMGMLHDQGQIKSGGNTYVPRIGFVDSSGDILVTDEDSDLHEYAFGSTSEAYGE